MHFAASSGCLVTVCVGGGGVDLLPLTFFVCRHFDVKPASDVAAAAALFSVPDFVGDASKAIASRIRGAVASVQFDDFHKVRRLGHLD